LTSAEGAQARRSDGSRRCEDVAQAIRKVHDLAWSPSLFFMSNLSISVGAVMIPAGAENGIGIISGAS